MVVPVLKFQIIFLPKAISQYVSPHLTLITILKIIITKMKIFITSIINYHTALLYCALLYCAILCSGTAQFKLDRIHVQQGHDTTRFSFHTRASLCVHERLVTSNLPCKALMYTLDMRTMHAYMSGIYKPNLDYVCMQIVSHGQRNKHQGCAINSIMQLIDCSANRHMKQSQNLKIID